MHLQPIIHAEHSSRDRNELYLATASTTHLRTAACRIEPMAAVRELKVTRSLHRPACLRALASQRSPRSRSYAYVKLYTLLIKVYLAIPATATLRFAKF